MVPLSQKPTKLKNEQMMMQPTENPTGNPAGRLDKIIDDGLCSGCGLCVAMCPDDALDFVRDANGEPRPMATDSLTDAHVDLIYNICPGLQITGLPPALAEAAPHQDLIWGPYHDIHLGWATDADIRHKGSTGGVLTALACYLLDSGLVSAIAHVRPSVDADKNPVNFGMATLSRTSAEVRAATGSRYGPSAPLIGMDALLDAGAAFALIAKPCDLNAMRNLAKLDPRVDQLVRYWLTPVCGGYLPDIAFQNFMDEHALNSEQLAGVRYRGMGCPGPTSLTFKDGKQIDYHYHDFWGEDESQWSLPFRCKMCADGIGEGADIAAADTWEAGSPDRIEAETDKGANSLLVRTKAGADLVAAAVAAGALTLDRPLDVAFMNWSQPHHVRKKKAGLARMRGLAEAGSLAPQLVDIRADALDASLSGEQREAEQAGAKKRAIARAEKRAENRV